MQNVLRFCRTKRCMVLILIIMFGLGIGGFYVYNELCSIYQLRCFKNISNSEKSETPSVVDEELKEKILQSFPEVTIKPEFGYGTGGAWNIPLGYLQKNRNDWNPIDIIWERAMPGFALWQQIEPEKGQYNWEKIDEYIRGAQEKGIQTLITIQPFTDWDQETCNSDLEWQSNTGGKDPRDFLSHAHRKGKPCDMEAYKEFLRRLVERYDGDDVGDISGLRYPVTHWEIGNEPDVGDDFQGSAEDYFEILKVSYVVIKETDPDAKVLIAAIGIHGFQKADYSKWTNFDTLKLFELGAVNYFDIMNGHSFGGHRTVREFLEKYGAGDKPMWVTEPTGVRHYRQEGQTEEELILTIVQVFIDEAEHGVTRLFLGGSDTSIPILQKAANYIRYGELEPFEVEKAQEKPKRKIVGKCDCNALYDFYNTGPEVQEYAQAVREDCNNACGLTNEMDKGSCYARLAMGLYENGTWVGDCVCRDILTGKVRDWCYAHSTVVFRQGDNCDKVQAADAKQWCTSPPP